LARRGLRLLLTLPDTPERTRQELRLQLALATPLMSLKGYAAPEVEEAYSRAYALCSNSANDVETYQALMGLGAFYFFRPQIRIGVEILDKLLPLAEASQNSVLISLAHFAAGSVLSHSGDLARALEHIASSLGFYDPQKHSLYLSVAGPNPGLIGRSQWGRLLCLSGRPDQGKLKAAEALAEARRSGHSFSVCFALVFSAWVLEYCGDAKTCMDAAGEAVKIAAEQGYTMHRAWAGTLHGWALSELGALDEGIAQMEESLEGMRLLGTELIRPEFLSLLAAAVAKRGDVQGALNLVNQALATVENTGEHYYDAELHRLKGILLLSGSNGRAVEAETSMQRAVEIARTQSARCFELRAATSLARLYLDRKRSEETRRSLAHV
jgi:predicted ATPase